PRRVGPQAALLDAALGDDHVVRPGVDEADRAIVLAVAHRLLGLVGEVPQALQLVPAGHLHGDDVHAAGQAVVGPGFGVEVDPVPSLVRGPAQVGDVRLRAPPGRVDTLEIEGEVHDSALNRVLMTADWADHSLTLAARLDRLTARSRSRLGWI